MDQLIQQFKSFEINDGIIGNKKVYLNVKNEFQANWLKETNILNEKTIEFIILIQKVFKEMQCELTNDEELFIYDNGALVLRFLSLIFKSLEMDEQDKLSKLLFEKGFSLYILTTRRFLKMLNLNDLHKIQTFINMEGKNGYITNLIELSLSLKQYELNIVKNFWLSTKEIIPKLTSKNLINNMINSLIICVTIQTKSIKNNFNQFNNQIQKDILGLYKVILYFYKIHMQSLLLPISSIVIQPNIIQLSKLDILISSIMEMIISIQYENMKLDLKSNKDILIYMDEFLFIKLFRLGIETDKDFIIKVINNLDKTIKDETNINKFTNYMILTSQIIKEIQCLLYKQTITEELVIILCLQFEYLIKIIKENQDFDLNIYNNYCINHKYLLLQLIANCHIDNFIELITIILYLLFKSGNYLKVQIRDIASELICNIIEISSAVDLTLLFYLLYTKLQIEIQNNKYKKEIKCTEIELLILKIFWNNTKIFEMVCEKVLKLKTKVYFFQLIRHFMNEKPTYFINHVIIDNLIKIFNSINIDELNLENNFKQFEGIFCFIQMMIDNNQPLSKLNNINFIDRIFNECIENLKLGNNCYYMWNILNYCYTCCLQKDIKSVKLEIFINNLDDNFKFSEFTKYFLTFAFITFLFSFIGILSFLIVSCNTETFNINNNERFKLIINKIKEQLTLLNSEKINNAFKYLYLCSIIKRSLSFCENFKFSDLLFCDYPDILKTIKSKLFDCFFDIIRFNK